MRGSNRSATVTGVWRSEGVLHTGLVHLLVAAISATTAGVAFAQNSPAPDPSIIAAQVNKFGMGKSVKIRLVDGERLNGHIQAIGAEGFSVKLAKSGGERSIPYSQVAEIKDPSPLFWILVGAAIVIVIIVAAKR